MALPAGMGLSAAAAAAGYSYMSPNPTPEPVDSALVTHITEAEDPEEMLLGGLAALSEPEAPTQAPGNGMLGGSAEGRGGPRRYDGDNGGIGMDPARVQLRQQQQQQQPQPQQSQQEQQQQQQQCPIMPPVIPPRIHQVTSPPPPQPPASMLAVLGELRSSGEMAVLPGRGVGLQAVLCAKRGQRALRASAALSEEVKKRFPTQAAQADRLSVAEDKLDKKISAVRRRLYSKMEGVEWASKFLRAWLSLEVISTPKPQQGQQQQKRQDEATDAVKEGAGWFVMARVQGTVIDAPTDGVERRFTSFFSKVALKLDSKAFPEVASVEWVRSSGCEELHCVELKLPLERALALGVKAVDVKVSLHPRLDDGRPRRFTLSRRLRQALSLSDRVETKPVLVAAVCEALRHRGLLPPRGEAGLGRGGAGGVPMVACDLPLEEILGTSAFPFSQLEEAMGPHVEPAAPPVLEATIPLEGGSTRETMLDVRVDTEAPFQLQAVKALLGGGGKTSAEKARGGGEGSSSSGQEDQGKAGLGVLAVREREEQMQLDRQISSLMEAVNSSGRRAAMLRALSENPMEVVPKLEAQILADEEMLAAAAGIERPAREEDMEPWLDLDVCAEDKVIEARAERWKKEQVRREIDGQRKERAVQHARAEAALLQAAREQRKKQREARAAAQAAAEAAAKQASEREQQQQQQRQRLREAQERAVLEGRERITRNEKQQKEHQQHQRMQQAVMLTQRQQAQAQGISVRAAGEAPRQQDVQEQRGAQNAVSGVAATAIPGAAAGGSANSTVIADTSSSMPSDSFARLRAMQLQQQVSAAPGHRLGQQQQQQQQQRRISMAQCTSNASPRERVTSPISPRDHMAQQQQQQLQRLGLAQASPIGFPGQQKPQQSLSLPPLGPGMGPELQERFQPQQQQQQQHHQEAASTMAMDAEERKRQELLEQTLLSQNDDLDPLQPPAPSPRRQDHEQQYQWPGSTTAATFKNPDVTERGYRQQQPIGLGGQQQQLQQMNRQQPRVGSAGSPQDNGRQQMEEVWRRRRCHLEQQRQQQKGIASGGAVHGSFQDQAALGQSQKELHYSSSSSSSSSPPPSVPTTSSARAGASAGPAQDAFRGGLVIDRPRSEQRVEDQRRYRQRQYQQLAQLAHIQQQQQRQGLVQGLMQGGHGGNSHPTTVSAASGVFRSPTQRGTAATLQQQQQQQQVEWARRSVPARGQSHAVPARGQSHAGGISSELTSTPQSLSVVDGGGGQSVGMPMEPGLGGGRMMGHSQQQHQAQPQSAVSSYSGWQSVEERRRSENTDHKR